MKVDVVVDCQKCKCKCQMKPENLELLGIFADALTIQGLGYNFPSLDRAAHWWAGIKGVDLAELGRFHDRMLLRGLVSYAREVEQQQLVDRAMERLASQCAEAEERYWHPPGVESWP